MNTEGDPHEQGALGVGSEMAADPQTGVRCAAGGPRALSRCARPGALRPGKYKQVAEKGRSWVMGDGGAQVESVFQIAS